MKKKGFTLIELLAVIVILAILALITVPIVINIINDAKEESLKRSINYYLDVVTNTITKENIKHKYNPDTCIIQEDGNLICSENGNELTTSNGTNKLEITMKGKKPSSGTIKLQNGKIIDIEDIYLESKYVNFDKNGKLTTKIRKAPGLYDEKYNLLATWHELVTTYKLDITKNYNNLTSKEKDSGSMYDVINNNSKLRNAKILIIEENTTNNKIGNYAFYKCTGLTSIIIPNNVTIGYGAFSGCTGLTSITIPSSVTSIESNAFKECTGLTSITIPSSVTSIESSAFENCTGLTSINVVSGNTKYEDRGSNAIIEKSTNKLILGCKNTVIPNSVTSIGEGAFYGCTELTSITIPSSVTSIESSAFKECTGLTSITIPSSVTSIGSSAFYGCTSLTSINVVSGNTKYEDRGSNAIIEKSTNKLILGCKNTVIPNSVTNIDQYAFAGCTGLTSIVIPSSVTSIGFSAFYNCTGLTSITIPNSVTSIGNYAFAGCIGLTSITLPNSVTSIGDYTFQGCSGLTSITIPNSVTSIGSGAFQGCSGLTSITIPNSVTSIGHHAFSGCTGLTSITIPNSVTSIGNWAFAGCTGLTNITFNNTSGWFIANKSNSATGTSIDVTNANTNANNLVNTYSEKFWKRN